jgi:hypothetical protein
LPLNDIDLCSAGNGPCLKSRPPARGPQGGRRRWGGRQGWRRKSMVRGGAIEVDTAEWSNGVVEQRPPTKAPWAAWEDESRLESSPSPVRSSTLVCHSLPGCLGGCGWWGWPNAMSPGWGCSTATITWHLFRCGGPTTTRDLGCLQRHVQWPSLDRLLMTFCGTTDNLFFNNNFNV